MQKTWLSKDPPARTTLLFFVGGIRFHQLHYSGGVRQRAFINFHNRTGYKIVEGLVGDQARQSPRGAPLSVSLTLPLPYYSHYKTGTGTATTSHVIRTIVMSCWARRVDWDTWC